MTNDFTTEPIKYGGTIEYQMTLADVLYRGTGRQKPGATLHLLEEAIRRSRMTLVSIASMSGIPSILR